MTSQTEETNNALLHSSLQLEMEEVRIITELHVTLLFPGNKLEWQSLQTLSRQNMRGIQS